MLEDEILLSDIAVAEDFEDTEVIETVQIVEVGDIEPFTIEADDAFAALGTPNEYLQHPLLNSRDLPDQHPITAITGLRDELDEIERLKTVYSDGVNVANYYEWNDGLYDEYGYFVSIVPNTSTIKICDGSDIFGVSIENAGFIGGQNALVARDRSYGLIATSGLVDVRCELDVVVGDCIISNEYGYATKSDSGHGYHVLARENKNGVEYAVISLGVQADITNALSVDLNVVKDRVKVNEKNIVSAINVANQAYNKASESIKISEDAVKDALESLIQSGEANTKADDAINVSASTSQIAAQAKAIAESAAVSAESMRNEAVEKANEAWTNTNNLIDTLEPITTWEKDGVSGVDYLTTQMDNGIATTYDIKVVDDKTEIAMNAISRNAKELQSLMTAIDKYSVGEYSQAHGLTLEQAQSILEPGMIYVPTSHEKLEAGTKYHEEKYPYTDENGDPQIFTRNFVPGYLYQWGQLDSGLYGWITVDKSYQPIYETDADETNSINTSAMAVYFSNVEVVIGDDNRYGYWYTNGDEIIDRDGNIGTYDSYTLYKWENPDGEDGYWFAVATLAGNVNNRATSQVRQTTNEIAAEIINAYGAVAGFGAKLSETESTVHSLASWKNGDGEVGEAIIRQVASDDGASIVISTLQRDYDGKITSEASLTLSADSNDASVLRIDANYVNFEAGEFTIDASKIDFTASDFTIDADRINFDGYSFSVSADDIDFTTGDFTIDASHINFDADDFTIDANKINFTSQDVDFSVAKSVTFSTDQYEAIAEHISFEAPEIDLTGYVTFSDLQYEGWTTINGSNITTGTIDASQVTVTNIDATQITTNKLTAEQIDVDGIITAKGIAVTSDIPDENDITLITEKAIETTEVTAKNLKVDAANVSGTLRMGDDGYISIDGEDEGDGIVYYVNLPGIRINNFGTFLDDGLVVTDATIGGLGIRDDSITGDYWYVGNDKFKCGDFVADSDGNITASSVSTDSFSYTGAGSLYLFSINGTDCSYENISADNISTNSLSVSWMELGYTDNYRESYCFVSFGNTSVDLYTDSGYLVGTWYADSCLADSSDVNKKNSIQDPSDQYDVVFKNLSPKTFKYNNGTSDRKHFGFIAQEVEQAVIESGLTTQDFAGFIRAKELNEETKEFEDVCYLRYGEFVALNTWQIQKLQTRVTELENQIIELQNLINGGDE